MLVLAGAVSYVRFVVAVTVVGQLPPIVTVTEYAPMVEADRLGMTTLL
jgi:hypothetical protein